MRCGERLHQEVLRRIRSEQGLALVMALITIVVLLLLTAALVTAAVTETYTAQTAEDSARAFLVADAAAARAMASLRLDANWTETDPGGQDAVDRCPGGELYDLLAGECMRDVPYPRYGAIAVGPAAPPGGAPEPVCAAKGVTSPEASPAPLPPEQSFGRYTVTVVEVLGPNRIRLRAVGRVGRATRGFEFTVDRVTPADFVSYSALRVDATRVGNGTFRIHGSVYVRGNWEFHGNSQQLNDRPVSEADTLNPVYDNQTFVCGDLVLSGNPQIGEPNRPMLGVHIAGTIRGAGQAYEVHALLRDTVVPDIRLVSVPQAVACVKGVGDQSACDQSFPGLWNAYTNSLDTFGGSTRMRLYVWSGSSWDERLSSDLQLGSESWRIPKRGREDACRRHERGASLDDVLEDCAAYYDGSSRLYVGARQVIYIPGSLSVLRDIDYRVDDDPTQACDPGQRDSDPCRPDDASLFLVACEAGTACDPTLSSPAYGFNVREMLRAQRRASAGPLYPQTTFPTRDALAVLVHGRVRFGLSGSPANQEINLVVLSGCDTRLPPDRCDLTMQKNLQLYGSVISRLLVFEQNVDLYQVPDLRSYLPITLDNFLAAPGGSAVVVTQWREIGF
ncbi:MAG: hypothetical protein QN140_08985 [Armatimonadota bacterium]|nr:hypothetical protein [Armatimonadota bacterium]MDR7440196.1 hypothetical protein [Armatimonadota bacterium]MDR7562593.1 hypothetical protein [Armatimonadota bacterium]